MIETMNKTINRGARPAYIQCRQCQKQTPRARDKICQRCRNQRIDMFTIGRNNNEGQLEIEQQRLESIINNGINLPNSALNNQGFISTVKNKENLRLFAINPNGFGPDSKEKLEMLKTAIKHYEIDVILMSSPDRRWTSSRIERLRYALASTSKHVEIIATDSGEKVSSTNGYLPGGTIAIILGRFVGMLQKEDIRTDKKGRWSSFTIKGKAGQIRIINLYRIPDSTSSGILTSRAQYDRHTGKVQTTKYYREEILEEIATEIRRVKSEGISDIIVSGDFNQDILSERLQKLIRENGLYDVHWDSNISIGRRDKTHMTGSTQIDAVLGSENVLQCTEGSKMIDFNEILISDHRGFLIDIDCNRLLNIISSKYDNSYIRSLNPTNREHRRKFKEKLDEYLKKTNLQEIVNTICTGRPTASEMNRIDEEITYILNAAKNYAEGPCIDKHRSQSKQMIVIEKKYIKELIRKKKGRKFDDTRIIRRGQVKGVDYEHLSIIELEEKLAAVVEEWDRQIKDEKLQRETKLLELYPTEIAGDDEDTQKRRKKALNTLNKARFRQRTFKILSRGVGKGTKTSLKKIRIENNEGGIEREIYDRKEMENKIITYNRDHFRQAFETIAYTDKIYTKLEDEEIRHKILSGDLDLEECSYKDVYDFLKLLAKPNHQDGNSYEEITTEEWIEVVKKAKKQSTSSIFSNRTYSVYKCALDNENMTNILVQFYNTLFTHRIYLKRWLKILDIILEKGKGPILGKLRTIQLYEADLQLLMRIFIGGRNDENVENDSRISKFNYGSRKSYSIDEALLEKRLMYDTSIRDGQPMIHNISDLKACYDRQLPNIGGIVQESVGVARNPILMFQKVLPIMKHYVCTDFGISTDYYGNKSDRLGGTGQGNSLSGAICRDTSCIIFKFLEDQRLGAIIEIVKTNRIIQRVAIAFVDDTDFYTNGRGVDTKMQKIMNIYTSLYEATGGKIQQVKILFYCWKWKYVQGHQIIERVDTKIFVHGQEIKQLEINESTRTLGVHLSPSLCWKGQFEVMRKKLHESITKIMNIDINPYQASVYFNVYMIKSVFFGCGVINLNEKQELELRKLYEEPMLIKLGFSRNFPRKVLYMRKSALGIGLMAPKTIIDTMKLKLYIGNVRRIGNATQALDIHHDFQQIEAGRNCTIGEDSKNVYWKETWIDEVNQLLWQRKMSIVRNPRENLYSTSNKTIMEYAIQYVESNKLPKQMLYQINFVRLKKAVILPAELVGFQGRKQTSCYRNLHESSSINWRITKEINESISCKQRKIWKEFLEWLGNQSIETHLDIVGVEWKWRKSEDGKIMRIERQGEIEYFRHLNQHKYVKTTEIYHEDDLNYGFVGVISKDNHIFVYGEQQIDNCPSEITPNHDKYPAEIEIAIQNRSALAATDASMNGKYIATHWIITTNINDKEISGGVQSNKWNDKMIPAGEGIGLLSLLRDINIKTKEYQTGKIVIYNDNKYLIRECLRNRKKASEYTYEAGSVTEAIRRELKASSIEIEIKYSNDRPKPNTEFYQDPSAHLMRKCDQQSKQKYRSLCQGRITSTPLPIGIGTIQYKDKIIDKSIQVLIREHDAIVHEKQAAKDVIGEHWKWIDREARNSFSSGVGAGTIKCVWGYNHHGIRNAMINRNLVSSKCPRCNNVEDWEHVITCPAIDQLQKEYLKEIKEKGDKIIHTHEDKELFKLILNDVTQYLAMNTEWNYVTTQHIIGMKNMFKGWIVKGWDDPRKEQSSDMRKVNIMLVKASVSYYSKSWVHRNEMLHNPEKYKEYVVQWHHRIVALLERSNRPVMRQYLRTQQIDTEKCSSGYIRQWNISTMEMYKKTDKENLGDIRSFFKRIEK